MKTKHIILNIFFVSIIFSCGAQNLVPFNWNFSFQKDTVAFQNRSVNLLLSWERQGLSYLSPKGVLTNSFYVPKRTKPINLILEINLLLQVHDIYINGHYLDGGFKTDFVWAATPNYKSKKIKIPAAYLNFGASNTIKINCSNYSYTGGKSHNKVLVYPESSVSKSIIKLLFDSKQHVFKANDNVSFKINTIAASRGEIDVLIRNDYHDTLVVKKISAKKGEQNQTINLNNENLPPGFYEVIAVLNDNGYVGHRAWFTIAPTKIKKSTVAPSGFDAYWDSAIRELKSVDPQYKVTRVDSLCTAKRDGYIVEMTSIKNLTIKGYYFVPKEKKTYAAILNLPGYGYGFEYLDEFRNVEEDVIELAICVRGHGISKDAFNTEFPAPGFIGYNICDVDKIGYRQIYMDCIRAVQFLLSRDEVDTSKIGVVGGSQGGGLALMTAGLMPNSVKACAYFDPFPTDLRNHILTRTMIKDEVKSYLKYYNNACDLEHALNTFDFLDTSHFAKNITCPTFYATALLDDDCTPRIGFVAYNKIESKKEFKVFPEDSHIGESNWKKDAMSFFKKQFNF